MLKKGHNILLFSLEALDMLTCEFRQFPSPRSNYTQKKLKHKCTGDGWVIKAVLIIGVSSKDLQLVFEAKFNLLHSSFHRLRFISSSAEIEMVVKPVIFN